MINDMDIVVNVWNTALDFSFNITLGVLFDLVAQWRS